jgi:hypothetical protein
VAPAVKFPSLCVKTYIGLPLTAMGFLLTARHRVKFSWLKAFIVKTAKGFDKAICRGDFGSVAVRGLLTFGQSIRNSLGIAVFTVTVVNLAGVVLYLLFNNVGTKELCLIVTLSVGALSVR